VVALVALLVAVYALFVAISSLQIVKEPQLSFYLQAENGPSGTNSEYTFGIENNGVVSATKLSANYISAVIDGECLAGRPCGSFDIQERAFFGEKDVVTELKAGQEVLANIPIYDYEGSRASKDVVIIAVSVDFRHNLDKRIESKEIIFVVDGHRVYTIETANQVERLKPYINVFWELSAASTFFDQRIYWRELD
jgi:hypothetical protein